MTFARWFSFSDEERESEKRSWRPFEPGYWHTIATEAAAQFNAEFGSKRHVSKVFKSLYRGRELIVAVKTDGKVAKLPESFCGFRVVQFPDGEPEGVLVEVGPPSQLPRRSKKRESQHARSKPPVRATVPGTHKVLELEGEIDLHQSANVAMQLRALIAGKPETIVIDLTRVTYIDSGGLATLIEAMQKVEAYRGQLYLVGMDKNVRAIFETSRLDQVFAIKESAGDVTGAK